MNRTDNRARRLVEQTLALLVGISKRLGPLGRVLLRLLERLPGSWRASLALSRMLETSRPKAALFHAERLIRRRPSLWIGHVERCSHLQRLNEEPLVGEARLAAAFLCSESSLSHLGTEWFGAELIRAELATACEVVDGRLEDVALDIVDMGGRAAAGVALKRMVQWGGADVVPIDTRVADVIADHNAAAIATYMRQSGSVSRVARFLDLFPQSAVIVEARRGVDQDLRALRGETVIRFRRTLSIPGQKGRAIYLLHNSIPYNSGGYAIRTHGLLQGLSRANKSVIGVTRPGFPSHKGFEQIEGIPAVDRIDGIEYHRLLGAVPSSPRRNIQGFVDTYVDRLRPIVESHRPSVIHSASNWWNGFGGVAASRAFGIPSIYEVRGLWELTKASRVDHWSETEIYSVDAEYETQAASMANHVIAITNGLKAEMVSRGIAEEKITVVPNAVDPGSFFPRAKDMQLASGIGLGDECVIGFAGSLTFYEGLDDLFNAAAEIRMASSASFALLIVGDGPVKAGLEDLAAELGLSDITRFTGRVPHSEVSRYMSLMDITPFPRKALPVSELVTPLKPLESMASGIAVLAADVSALREMIPDGAGLFYEKGDTTDLARKLQLLIEDEPLRERLAETAREWVLTERNWSKVSRLVAEVYEALEAR